MGNPKRHIRSVLNSMNLVPTRRRPFLTRRYPYRGRKYMLDALGPHLAAETTWPASDAPPQGALAEIFAETDNIEKWAHYLPVYESVLSRSKPIRMLEIGVCRGGSLRMWRRYLHPESIIVGVDIDPECKQYDDPSQDVHVRIGAQQDTAFLQDVADEFGPFDVILDDGSHMTSHMVQTFKYLFLNGLAEEGIYIVEDMQSNYWKWYRDSSMSFVDFTKCLIDAMHAHYQVTDSAFNFHTGDLRRRTEVTVPIATTLLGKVEIYDAIAVVHRARRELSRTIHR